MQHSSQLTLTVQPRIARSIRLRYQTSARDWKKHLSRGTSCRNVTVCPGKTEANLQPYTATLESLPANLPAPMYLPKVGSQTAPTEEDTRESLRRFIVEWQTLIGAEPNQLSLVERTDEPSGVKVARYEQRPFRYPLRGGFGTLVIRFRSNGQLVGLSSNCIPNADRLQCSAQRFDADGHGRAGCQSCQNAAACKR